LRKQIRKNMATLGTMIDRIEAEIGRSDLTAAVRDSIQTAIRFYERRRFYFNELRSSFSTSASKEYYGSADAAFIARLVDIDSITVDVNTSTYPVVPRDFSYIDQVQTNAGYTGDPTDYVYYNLQLRFYPIPQTARAVNVSGVQKFVTLTATNSTNAWFVDAEALIRSRAKYELYHHRIQKPEKAAQMRGAELDALAALEGETFSKIAGRLRPTAF